MLMLTGHKTLKLLTNVIILGGHVQVGMENMWFEPGYRDPSPWERYLRLKKGIKI